MSDDNTELKGLILHNEAVAIENKNEEAALAKFNESFFKFHFIPAGRALVKLAIKHKDWEGAKALLNKLCDYHGDVLSYYNFGQVYSELNQRDKAVKAMDGYIKHMKKEVELLCAAQFNRTIYSQKTVNAIKWRGYIIKPLVYLKINFVKLVIKYPSWSCFLALFALIYEIYSIFF